MGGWAVGLFRYSLVWEKCRQTEEAVVRRERAGMRRFPATRCFRRSRERALALGVRRPQSRKDQSHALGRSGGRMTAVGELLPNRGPDANRADPAADRERGVEEQDALRGPVGSKLPVRGNRQPEVRP